jgi:hypothetical protein
MQHAGRTFVMTVDHDSLFPIRYFSAFSFASFAALLPRQRWTDASRGMRNQTRVRGSLSV